MRKAIGLALVVLAGHGSGSERPADVSPGDKINASNADKVKDLLSPGLLWCVKRGFRSRFPRLSPSSG